MQGYPVIPFLLTSLFCFCFLQHTAADQLFKIQLFSYPLGDRGEQGPPGEPPKLKPSMMMEVKGEKGDVGETGTKGFFGLKGQWSRQSKESTFTAIDQCLSIFSVAI